MMGFQRILRTRRILHNQIVDKSSSSFFRSMRFLSSSSIFSPIQNLMPTASFKRFKTSKSIFNPWINVGMQRRSMFIQTQSTPNPSFLMFYPGKPVMEVGSADFPNAHAAMTSPLTKTLFWIDGVTRVFYGSDFVTVTKFEEASWDYLKPEDFAAIMDFYTFGNPLFLDSKTAASMDTTIKEDDLKNCGNDQRTVRNSVSACCAR